MAAETQKRKSQTAQYCTPPHCAQHMVSHPVPYKARVWDLHLGLPLLPLPPRSHRAKCRWRKTPENRSPWYTTVSVPVSPFSGGSNCSDSATRSASYRCTLLLQVPLHYYHCALLLVGANFAYSQIITAQNLQRQQFLVSSFLSFLSSFFFFFLSSFFFLPSCFTSCYNSEPD